MILKKFFGIFVFSLICTSVFAIQFTVSVPGGSPASFNFLSGGKLILTIDGTKETLSYSGNPNANGKIIIKAGRESLETEIYDGIMEFMGLGIESTESQKRTPIKTFTATYGNKKISVGVLNSKYVRLKIDSDDSYKRGSFALKYSGDYAKNGTLTAAVDDSEIKFELYNGLLVGYNLVLRDTKNATAKPLKTFYCQEDKSSYITVENDKIISITSKNWNDETTTVGATYSGSFLKDGNISVNIYDGKEPSTETLKVSNGCILFKSKLFKAKDSKPLGKFICADDDKNYLVIDSDNIFTAISEYYTETYYYTGNFFSDGQIKYYDDIYTLKIKNGCFIRSDSLYYNEKNRAPDFLKEFININDRQHSFSFYENNVFKYKLYSDRWGIYDGDIQKGTVSKINFDGASYDVLHNKTYLLYSDSVFAESSAIDGIGSLKTVASYSATKKKNDTTAFKYEFYEDGLFCNISEGWSTRKTYGFYEGDPSKDGKLVLTLTDGNRKEITVSDSRFNGINNSDKDRIYFSSSGDAFKESVYISGTTYGDTIKYSFTDPVNLKKISVSKSGKETIKEGTYTGIPKAGSTIKINIGSSEEEIIVGENFFWGTGYEKNRLYILEGTSLGEPLEVFSFSDKYSTTDYRFLKNGILQINTKSYSSTKSEYKKYSGDPTKNGTISYENSLNEETVAQIINGAFIANENRLFKSDKLKQIASFEPSDKSYGYSKYIFYEGNFIENLDMTSSGECYSKNAGTYDGNILSDRKIRIRISDKETELKICQPYLFDGTQIYKNPDILKTGEESKVIAEFFTAKPAPDTDEEGSYIFYDNGMFSYTFGLKEKASAIQGSFEGDPENNGTVSIEYWKPYSSSAAKSLTISNGWFHGIESGDKNFIYVNSEAKQAKALASYTGNDENGNIYTMEFAPPVSFEVKCNGANIKSGYYFGDPSSDGETELKERYKNNYEIKIENGIFSDYISEKNILFIRNGKKFGNLIEEFSNESGTETYSFLEDSVLEIKDNASSRTLYFKYTGNCKNGEKISFGTSHIKINGNGFMLNNSLFKNKNFRTLATFSVTENSVTYKYLFHEGNYLEHQIIDDRGNISRNYYTYSGNPNANGTIRYDNSQTISIRDDAFIKNGKLFCGEDLKILAVYSASDKTSAYMYVFHENNYLEYRTKDSSGTIKYVYSTYEGDPAADGKIKLFADEKKSFNAKIKKGILTDKSKLKFTKEK